MTARKLAIIKRVLARPSLLYAKARQWASERTVLTKYRSSKEIAPLRVQPVIWVRTPKTASSAVRQILSATGRLIDLQRESVVEVSQELCEYKIISIGTNQVREFRDAHPAVWERALRWAVVRHPYSRVLSAWHYMDSLRTCDLDELLRNPPTKDSPSEYHHFTSSFFEMLSVDGDLIVNDITLYEDLERSLADLFKKLGVEFHGLPVVNVTPGKKRYELTEWQKQRIFELYEADFEAFGYAR